MGCPRSTVDQHKSTKRLEETTGHRRLGCSAVSSCCRRCVMAVGVQGQVGADQAFVLQQTPPRSATNIPHTSSPQKTEDRRSRTSKWRTRDS